MSKKKLLEEGTVRRFMKLAGTEALTTNILKEQDIPPPEGEPVAEAPPAPGEDEPDLDADVGDLDLEPEEPEEEPEEVEGEVEDAVRAMVDAIADVAADFGVDVDVETEEAPEIEVGAEPEPEEELELGGEEGEITGELGGEEPLQEQGKGLTTRAHPKAFWEKTGDKWNCVVKETPKGSDLGGRSTTRVVRDAECSGKKKPGETPPVDESRNLDEIDYVDEDAIMNEVFHRVKNRLLQEKRADDMSSVLAKRIMKRLGKKLR